MCCVVDRQGIEAVVNACRSAWVMLVAVRSGMLELFCQKERRVVKERYSICRYRNRRDTQWTGRKRRKNKMRVAPELA